MGEDTDKKRNKSKVDSNDKGLGKEDTINRTSDSGKVLNEPVNPEISDAPNYPSGEQSRQSSYQANFSQNSQIQNPGPEIIPQGLQAPNSPSNTPNPQDASQLEVLKLNRFHASLFINHYYGIFFPSFIGALLLGLFFGDLIITGILGEEPSNIFSANGGTQAELTRYQNNTLLAIGLFSALFLIILVDINVRKRGLNYNRTKPKMPAYLASGYILAALGLFFFVSFVFTNIVGLFGNSFLSAVVSAASIPDFLLVNVSDTLLVDKSLKTQFFIIAIAFLLTYLGLDFVFRGYMSNDARSYRVGPKNYVMLSAIVQGIAFTNGTSVFTNPVGFIYNFLIYFSLGLFAGILYWRTGRLWASGIFSILAFFLTNGSKFQEIFLNSLPDTLGTYNLSDTNSTTVEIIGSYFNYIQVALLISAPVVVILFYQESWTILKEIKKGFKQNLKPYGAVFLIFFIIDLIFSFFINITGGSLAGGNLFLLLFGYIIAIFILRFVINYILSFLDAPSPIDMIRSSEKLTVNEKFPIDVSSDIAFINSKGSKYLQYKVIAPLAGVLYIYALFVAGDYRNFSTLDTLPLIRYILFFIAIPTSAFVLGAYFSLRSYKNGYFFAESWRKRLYQVLLILYFASLFIWIRDASLISFSWAVVPLFLVYAITIWPRPLRSPIADFSKGFTGAGRQATFRWLMNDPRKFEEHLKQLTVSPINQVVTGSYITSALLNLNSAWELIEKLRNSGEVPEKIGLVLALGIIKDPTSEGVIASQLKDPDLELKKVSLWALGNVGSRASLSHMVEVLESTPAKSIIDIGEKAILKIDPEFPLSGLRDPLTLAV